MRLADRTHALGMPMAIDPRTEMCTDLVVVEECNGHPQPLAGFVRRPTR